MHPAPQSRQLRRAVIACHVLAARGVLLMGRVRARFLRVEVYGPHDPANGLSHDKYMLERTFAEMKPGAVYFQRYARGFGWGMCIRGEGQTNYLVRAVDIEGRGELGMSKFARFVAKRLGVRIHVHKSYHCTAPQPSTGPAPRGIGRALMWACLGLPSPRD